MNENKNSNEEMRGVVVVGIDGSVSQQCARRADCPVVIVHAPKPAATSPEPGEAASMQRRAAA
jgi:hypothetical protein